jgi:putative ABC transport system ATP-binding protein
MIIKLKDIVHVYKMKKSSVTALRGITADFQPGKFIAIMGPSGCGKTSLLHIIGGIIKPSSGKVIIGDEEITKLSEGQILEFRKKNVGMVFQFLNLFPTLTAYENIEFPLIIADIPKKDIDKRVTELLERINLSDKKNSYPDELSGGEQQRIAIACAIATDPKILLADEPTGHLDIETSGIVIGIFRELASKGKTVIVATHDNAVAKQADEIYYIRDGLLFAQPIDSREEFRRMSEAIFQKMVV